MNDDVEEEAPRPRPLSAGIWTLFSWLRRTDRSSSSESITSVGSDRTVASFDFLAPLHYKDRNKPLVLPHSPVTDTYKKRLLERNIRRQHDRDVTLRRKYGLYTEEGLGYDAFSLPPARKIPKDLSRLRRATSESVQRRAAYVPGKRRAPLPPTTNLSTSLPRNYKRKRPAPKPPVKLGKENKENIDINKNLQMSAKSVQDKQSSEKKILLKCEIEKPLKHDQVNVKLRSDKSFLKQIFDSKKRNSAIDTTHVKLLPSISELDKQAAEIIETKRVMRASGGYNGIDNILKIMESESSWICTICFRKYKITVTSCSFCAITKDTKGKNIYSSANNTCTQTEQNIGKSSRKNDVDEKKKLREMLKEMKDSLPKRSKQDRMSNSNILPATETPTLRIGSTIRQEEKRSTDIPCTEDVKDKERNTKASVHQAKTSFLLSQPSSSKQIVSDIVLSNLNRPQLRNKLNIEQSNNSRQVDKISINKNKNNGKTNEIIKNKEFEHRNVNDNSTVANIILYPANADIKLNTAVREGKNAIEKNTSKPNVSISSKDSKVLQNKSKLQPLLTSIKEVTVLDDISEREAKNKIESIRLGDVILTKDIHKNNTNSNDPPNVESSSNLHVPLKVSSLLNPLYCPKKKNSENLSKISQASGPDGKQKELPKIDGIINKPIAVSNANVIAMDAKPSTSSESVSKEFQNVNTTSVIKTKETTLLKESTELDRPNAANDTNFDHHARRRDLISQLEQAIAKGDEKTAAGAAAKLAKLKLSCSVLSFSSQIVSEPTILSNILEVTNNNSDRPNCQNKEILRKNPLKSAEKLLTNNVIHTREIPKIINKNNSEKLAASSSPINKPDSAPNPTLTTSTDIVPNANIPIEVWVEDKEAARGPIRLMVLRNAVVGDLKRQAEICLGVEIQLQRWIIGKTLCSNNNAPLTSLAGPNLVAPFYLCLVEAETNKNDNNDQIKTAESGNGYSIKEEKKDTLKSGDFYTELVKLEQQALVLNAEVFECGVCIEQYAIGAGVVLRECIHTFCKECLRDVVRHCEEPIVSCPAIGCRGFLQEREIRALLSFEEYEKWLARGLAAAESGTRNTFHCRTRDCTGWAFCEPGVRKFPCPVCKHTNCLPCQAVHEGETCDKYQAKLREALTAVKGNQTDEGTQALLKSLIDRGEALECPECKALIMKKWGCDWIKCSACKTEICWVTKGRRWGPGGKGDTSGGCRCGIDGKRCHPSCGYCH